ncbi:diguanylate cyclase domain-containing protein [Albirhodobacter sp. R86504]|uniref:diguanylate cyclase domain-containing protein n=1 Tax=Albirhodobacter sp. R86504 TaxID=3093848 RepID=UPI0036724377
MDLGSPSPERDLIPLLPEVIGRLMPMSLWIDDEHRIRMLGPTLEKLIGKDAKNGLFSDHFDLRRGRSACRGERLGDLIGQRLHLVPKRAAATILRGVAVPVGLPGSLERGFLFNTTFGVGLAEAVRDHSLTEADFAPSDLAMELLYLQEAKSVVMGELRALNSRLETARQVAEHQALTDPLTGLGNRRAFDQALARSILLTQDTGTPFAVAHLDLDLFKSVNDTMGHAAGDHVLLAVAEILTSETRRSDVVARVGGDEFMILMRGRADEDDLQRLGDRIIERLEQPVMFEGECCRISGSIGVAMSPSYPNLLAEDILADADSALYASKRRGRGRCTIRREGDAIAEEQRAG